MSGDHTINDFAVGERVKAHPATDTFMRGDVYGVIRKIGRRLIHVEMDRSGRTIRFVASNLLHLGE